MTGGGVAALSVSGQGSTATPTAQPRSGSPAPSLLGPPLRFAATGFFHTARAGGRWWLVAPDGSPFYSSGIDHVTSNPDTDRVTGQCPYCQTVAALYPSEASWVTTQVARLRQWGFNTVGAFSDTAEFARSMPYTVLLSMASGDDWFSPSFAEHARQVAETQVAPLRNDPNLVGYFLDSELHWGSDWREQGPLLDDYLALPQGSPGRAAAEKYVGNPSGFLFALATRYFQVTTAAIRAVDPNHLILGVKAVAQLTQPELLRAARPYVDVWSVDQYQLTPAVTSLIHSAWPYYLHGPNLLAQTEAIVGKPVMVAEYSFRASGSATSDAGPSLANTWPPTYPTYVTQEARAQAYRAYVQRLYADDFVVGDDWFEYVDEPYNGRFDGEDSNFGVLSVSDVPYSVLTSAMQSVHGQAPDRVADPGRRCLSWTALSEPVRKAADVGCTASTATPTEGSAAAGAPGPGGMWGAGGVLGQCASLGGGTEGASGLEGMGAGGQVGVETPRGPAGPGPADAGVAVQGYMTGMHVVHQSGQAPYLADAAGDSVLLRGVNDNTLVQYPANYPEAPPYSGQDFAEMAALGFNFLRLPVSWSRIMPEPGVIDCGYLSQVARVVHYASEYGIGVLVDMHQDRYSAVTATRVEADGAPGWALPGGGSSCAPVAGISMCEISGFENFWADGEVDGRPMQSWYLDAAAAVALAAGAGNLGGNIVGVELMNEPEPFGGHSPFTAGSLWPFYDRMISGLRSAGVAVPIWFESPVIRSPQEIASVARAFSGDPDLVYAYHAYTGVFSDPMGVAASVPALPGVYASVEQAARAFGTPFVVDEYGTAPTRDWNPWIAEQLSLQDQYLAGSSLWLWKQRIGYWYNWALVHLDGTLRSDGRVMLLGMPHVDSVPGRLVATSTSASQLSVTVDGPGGMALLWGGLQVDAGPGAGSTSTLMSASIDGAPADAACQDVSFSPGSESFGGCLVRVRVPAGRHVITLSTDTLPG